MRKTKYSPELVAKVAKFMETHKRREAVEQFKLPGPVISWMVKRHRDSDVTPSRRTKAKMVEINLPPPESVTVCRSCLKAFLELSR